MVFLRGAVSNLSFLYCMHQGCLRLIRIKDLPSVHGYADDTRLCALFHPNSFAAKDQAIKAIEICIADDGAW